LTVIPRRGRIKRSTKSNVKEEKRPSDANAKKQKIWASSQSGRGAFPPWGDKMQ
jgi:hypothetical protein